MDCESARLLLSTALDEPLTKQEQRELDLHLADCADCSLLQMEFWQMQDGFSALRPAVPDLTSALLPKLLPHSKQEASTSEATKPQVAVVQPKSAIHRKSHLRSFALTAAAFLLLLSGIALGQSGLLPFGEGGVYDSDSAAPALVEAVPEEAPMSMSEEAPMSMPEAAPFASPDGARAVPAPESRENDSVDSADTAGGVSEATTTYAAQPEGDMMASALTLWLPSAQTLSEAESALLTYLAAQTRNPIALVSYYYSADEQSHTFVYRFDDDSLGEYLVQDAVVTPVTP